MRNSKGQFIKGNKEYYKDGIGSFWSGKKRGPQSEEHKRKLREAKLKRPTNYWLGKNRSQETKDKISKFMIGRTGEVTSRWIKDRTLLKNYRTHISSEYKRWVKEVKKRDGNKCKINNSECSGRLEAHHILPQFKYPELSADINNGIALCHFHHPRSREKEMILSPFFQQLILEN